MKSKPNLRTLYSSKSSGMPHHFEFDLIYLFSQPILSELSNNSKLCNFIPPNFVSASMFSFLNFGGFPSYKKSLTMLLSNLKVSLPGLGRDRSIWVNLEINKLFIVTTFP